MHLRLEGEQIDRHEVLIGGVPEAHECFRRAVFNLLSTNRDDHGRNHGFRYDDRSRN